MMVPLLHHGMLLVGMPCRERALSQTTTGGTPYGPSRYTGGGKEAVSEEERQLCRVLGARIAKVALAVKTNPVD
jgi:NAD(P)H dehydrogenase (quinone)